MLTQLATVKLRLGFSDADPSQDSLLLGFINACSVSFDHECNRRLARAENLTEEFAGDIQELCVACYPVESIGKLELKTSEATGWMEQTGVDYTLRSGCIISLAAPLGGRAQIVRVTYTGGYVPPGTTPLPGQEPMPADLERAAVEQVAAWFMHRDKIGLIRNWPTNGTYQILSQLPVLPWVRQVLRTYQRWNF